MILIVDMNQKKDSLAFDEFVLPLASIVREVADYEVKHHSEIGQEIVNDYEKVILSGTPLKDMGYTEDIEGFGWIKEYDRPVLGICAGMQVIGSVFDSSLKKCQEIGMTRIETTGENPLFSGTFEAYELHNYTVEPSPDFQVTAQSEKCVQGIRHKGREVYGVQFHPEVRNKGIIKRFAKRKKEEGKGW